MKEKAIGHLVKTNPKRTQSKPIKANLHLTAENAEYAEKKDICVSDCPIEKYALYPIFSVFFANLAVNGKQTQSNPISKAKKEQIYFFKLFITLAELGAISTRPEKRLLVMKLPLPVFTIMAVVSAPAASLRNKPRGRVSRTTQLETIVSCTSSIRIPQLSQLRMAQPEILKC